VAEQGGCLLINAVYGKALNGIVAAVQEVLLLSRSDRSLWEDHLNLAFSGDGIDRLERDVEGLTSDSKGLTAVDK
jgi:hypothetical protein